MSGRSGGVAVAEGVAALLPAAGTGERLGLGPKAFIDVGGRPLLGWSIDAMGAAVDEIVVAVPSGWLERARHIAPHARVIEGGSTRQATVRALLGATEATYVCVHDAARPFLPAQVRDAAIAAARRVGAATAAVAIPDTVVDARSGDVLEREHLRAVQTPQAFARELLAGAHDHAELAGTSATDDTALVRRLGHDVELVEGSPWLFKITTPGDLAVARRLAEAWRDQ